LKVEKLDLSTGRGDGVNDPKTASDAKTARGPKTGKGPKEDPRTANAEAREKEFEALYAQLAQNAARLMVVHEASEIMRSTHDAEELAKALLSIIAEAVFASSACVAVAEGEGLKVLATHGLEDHEADELGGDPDEASIWFAVFDEEEPRAGEELTGELELDSSTFDLYLPLRIEEETLGLLALGKRVDGQAFSDQDRQLAGLLSTHLALALAHAALFEERNQRIERLSVLLQISREITSTLDLERVLGTIAQMVGMVLPNRRTTVASVSGGSVAIRASSDRDYDLRQAARDPFLNVLRWAHGSRQTVNTYREALELDPEADGRDVLLPWLSREDGPRGLAIIPMEDDQGVLGLLAIETDEENPPLEGENEELITILANQTTVAIRNAELYQQVPMIGMLEPILGKVRAARRASRRQLWTRGLVIAAVALVGFLVPLPTWVSGDAAVRPATRVPLRAATEGTVEEVLVSEGEVVEQGTVVARMRRDELMVELEQVRAAAQRATAEATRAHMQGDLATYRARQSALAEFFESEQFLTKELERTSLVAPIDCIVLTRDVELRRGQHLQRGEIFLELADLSMMEAEVWVPEEDVHRLSAGRPARLKVHAYPDRAFRGEVAGIAPRADVNGTFRVIVRFDNEDGALRPGMTGRAHLDAPNEPLLTRVLRPMLRWLRLKFWV
jgi:RND family efflux transporter MFP subunit